MAKPGRPSKYSDELAETICTLLMEGQSLVRICSHDNMPSRQTVARWLAAKPEFQQRYTRAREVQAEFMADELLALADDASEDFYGEGQPNRVAVQRSKLQIDTRKWVASKLLPRKYGERIDMNVTGELSLAEMVKEARARAGKEPR